MCLYVGSNLRCGGMKEAAIGSSPYVTLLRDEILEMDLRCMRLKESLLVETSVLGK